MGQKINPISLRISINRGWSSRWFFPAKGKGASVGRYPYAKFLAEDEAIRTTIQKKVSLAGIAAIEIDRTSNNLRVTIKAARPGLIIGQGGKGIEDLSRAIEKSLEKLRGKVVGKNRLSFSLNVEELKRSEVSATHLAQLMAWDLEKRFPFRRTMKKYLDQISQNKDVKGVKIQMSGRLDGAEISRSEVLKKGALPLQTLRANIDYGTATAHTTYGTIGLKVWIYKGEVFADKANEEKKEEEERGRARRPYQTKK